MRRLGALTVVLLVAAVFWGCPSVPTENGGTNGDSGTTGDSETTGDPGTTGNPDGSGYPGTNEEKRDTTDYRWICKDYSSRAPANVTILPIHGGEGLDGSARDALRNLIYDGVMDKGYAPLSTSFTDRTLREIGLLHTPVVRDGKWNLEPLKDRFTAYCDALAVFTIERYTVSGQPGRFGIEIWGKMGLFDTKTMEPLFEHYTRQRLHPTDAGGGRDRFIRRAHQSYVKQILGRLPDRKASAR